MKTENLALLEKLRYLWLKYPNEEFGTLLDRILSNSNKYISHCQTKEFIKWIDDELADENFTEEYLSKLRGKRYKEYHDNPELFAKEPKSLFINGEFNKDNYFGGDDIIRKFFDEVYGEKINSRDFRCLIGENTEFEYSVFGTLEVTYGYNGLDEEYTFSIVVRGIALEFDMDFTIIYTIKIDDREDRFSLMLVNGKEMTEKQYIQLLNYIKATGFDFDKGHYHSYVDEL